MNDRENDPSSDIDALRVQNERLYAMIAQSNGQRSLLGQELHDGPSQLLTAALLRIETYRDAIVSPSSLPSPSSLLSSSGVSESIETDLELLDTGIELLRQCCREVRHLIENFGPSVLSDHSLSDSLTLLFNDFMTMRGLKIDSQIELPDVGISSTVETAAYRIVQEALNNIAKHAGTNDVELRVMLDGQPGDDGPRLLISVSDNGVGFEEADLTKGPPSESDSRHGLSGMRRRATALGGSVHIESRPGEGTVLTATIPLMGQAGPA